MGCFPASSLPCCLTCLFPCLLASLLPLGSSWLLLALLGSSWLLLAPLGSSWLLLARLGSGSGSSGLFRFSLMFLSSGVEKFCPTPLTASGPSPLSGEFLLLLGRPGINSGPASFSSSVGFCLPFDCTLSLASPLSDFRLCLLSAVVAGFRRRSS